jgi:hypothetical protein
MDKGENYLYRFYREEQNLKEDVSYFTVRIIFFSLFIIIVGAFIIVLTPVVSSMITKLLKENKNLLLQITAIIFTFTVTLCVSRLESLRNERLRLFELVHQLEFKRIEFTTNQQEQELLTLGSSFFRLQSFLVVNTVAQGIIHVTAWLCIIEYVITFPLIWLNNVFAIVFLTSGFVTLLLGLIAIIAKSV